MMNHKMHKNVVLILWRRYKTILGRGSGLLISPNLVLTSAHNFFYEYVRIEDKTFEIYPGICGPLANPYRI